VDCFEDWATQATLDPEYWATESIRLHVLFKAAIARGELTGKDLACWCKDFNPCHVTPLLRLANPTPEEKQ
jgi:hypothetical protein